MHPYASAPDKSVAGRAICRTRGKDWHPSCCAGRSRRMTSRRLRSFKRLPGFIARHGSSGYYGARRFFIGNDSGPGAYGCGVWPAVRRLVRTPRIPRRGAPWKTEARVLRDLSTISVDACLSAVEELRNGARMSPELRRLLRYTKAIRICRW